MQNKILRLPSFNQINVFLTLPFLIGEMLNENRCKDQCTYFFHYIVDHAFRFNGNF